MKILFVIFMLLSWIPYLFLATSVTERKINLEYNCTVSKISNHQQFIGFSKVYYSGFNMIGDNEYIILPKFNIKGDIFFAECKNKTFIIGLSDFIKKGQKIHVYTNIDEINFFGYKLWEEENIHMFGTGWQ